MLELRKAGAHTVAQDEASCVVFGMPRRPFIWTPPSPSFHSTRLPLVSNALLTNGPSEPPSLWPVDPAKVALDQRWRSWFAIPTACIWFRR